MAELDLLTSAATAIVNSLSLSDVPEMIASILAGQVAIRQLLSAKDAEKMYRLEGIFKQVHGSFAELLKLDSTVQTVSETVRIQLLQVLKSLCEFKEYSDEARVFGTWKKLKSRLNRDGNYLEALTEELLHSIKLLKFSITLAGYMHKQKTSALTQLIADPVACEEWSNRFGSDLSSTPEFKEVVVWLDNYFHAFGENCSEYEATCNSCSFFSWYRHDSAWTKCEACINALRLKLTSSTDSPTQVKLHLFAKFCGENLLLALQDLIQSSHSQASSPFETISPFLHFEEDEFSSTLSQEGAPTEEQKDALHHNRIVFVGNSNHLADLHQWICRTVFKTVNKIESVPDFKAFKEWVKERTPDIKNGQGKILVVTNCQHCQKSKRTSSTDAVSEPSSLLAEKVYEYIVSKKLRSVGFALLTCSFATHAAHELDSLREMITSGYLDNYSVSSDARELARFIQEMFATPVSSSSSSKAAKSKGKGKGKKTTKPAMDKFTADALNTEEENGATTTVGSQTAPANLFSERRDS